MPVRDGERWIRNAIASVTAQTFADFELLVVDDGSTDKTRQMAAEAAQRDRRIRVIGLPRSGIVTALNRALDEARGKYLARLDADDGARPTRLERQVDFLNAQAAVGLVGSWADIIDVDGRTVGRLQPETKAADLARALTKRNPMLHSSVMWRAELCAVDGRYRAAFEGAEDYDLWLRMSERSLLANIPACLVQYRRHADNASERRKLRQMFSARLARRVAFYRRTFGRDPADELTAPPDWNVPIASLEFCRDDMELYRFLELSAPDAMFSSADVDYDIAMSPTGELKLTHDERRLAQLVILNMMADADRSPSRRMRLLLDFVRLHPARAVKILGSRLLQKRERVRQDVRPS